MTRPDESVELVDGSSTAPEGAKAAAIPDSLVSRFCNAVKRIVDSVSTSVACEDDGTPITGILPESVRYILHYQKALFKVPDIKIMLHPEFQGLGPYLALKCFSQDPVLQERVLKRLLPIMHSGADYRAINQVIKEEFDTCGREFEPVQGGKVAQVCRQGPAFFEERFTVFAQEAQETSHTPCLIANAALLGLKAFVKEMKDGSDLIILYPKGLGDDVLMGYHIALRDGQFEIEALDLEHFHEDRSLIIVDDTCKKGDTFRGVQTFVTGKTRSRIAKIICVIGCFKS